MLVDAQLQLNHDELYSSLLTSVATRKAHALYSVLLVLRWSLPKPHFRGKMRDTNLTHLFAMMYAQKRAKGGFRVVSLAGPGARFRER